MSHYPIEYSELKWRCRRGMLELDILLNTYLDNNFTSMTASQGDVFNTLLDYPDQVLFDLLMGKMQSSDENISGLVIEIQGIQQHSYQ